MISELSKQVASYKKRFNALKQARAPWISTWKELAKYVAPTRGLFEGENPLSPRRADYKALLDSTASLAVGVLGAGMMSGLTSPSRRWFDLTLSPRGLEALPGVAAWKAEVKKVIQRALAQSNVYSVLQGVYEEIAVFGTAAFLVEEDPQGGIFCRPFTAGEYLLDIDEKGRVNTFGREFYMTPAQLARTFGKAALPAPILRQLEEGNPQTQHKVMHLIFPNPTSNKRFADFTHFEYKSVYFMEDGTLLRRGGYHEFPVVAARWETKNTSEIYGRGPGWKCLGDVKMLQKMQKTKLVALDKNTNPPVMVSAHVQGEINLLPGGITRCNNLTDAAIKPAYQVSPDVAALEGSIEQVRALIRSQFFADVFLMLAQQEVPAMTATEVAERRQEKMLLLGPVLERLKTELLDPLMERTYYILLRQGLIPAAPEFLNGLDMQVQYISAIAQAQRATQLEPLSQGVAFAARLTQACPPLAQQVNYERALSEGLDSLGLREMLLKEKTL